MKIFFRKIKIEIPKVAKIEIKSAAVGPSSESCDGLGDAAWKIEVAAPTFVRASFALADGE